MLLFIVLLLLLLFVFALFLIYQFTKLDCDLTLLFTSKFGRSIKKFNGKVVWITGASSGIGEHLAYVLASKGAKLALSGTKQDQLNKVAQQCVSIGKYDASNVLVVPFDVTDMQCHQSKFDQVLAHFGKLDVLVNNAGRSQRAFFHEIDLEIDRAIFEVNLFSVINLTRVVLRYYMEHNPEGQFAVTSSTAGILGVPYSASYTGTKHALHGYFECLRMELGNKGIDITMMCPGPVFSNVAKNAYTGKLDKKSDTEHESNAVRMSTERCAYLMAVAIINRLDHVWISIQPVLTLHYLWQYFPSISRNIMPRFMTVERMNKLREGNR